MDAEPRIALPPLSRRDLLRAGVRGAGVLTLASAAPFLAACGGSAGASIRPAGSSPGAAASGIAGTTLTLGSNASDKVPKAALQAVVDGFTAATGVQVKVNTSDHASFQDQISAYLQGTPDDVFTWFAGDRMRFFAAQGLSMDASDVWGRIAPRYTDAFLAASSGSDGRQYFVPFYTYPWVVLYRASIWAKHGYAVPSTLAQLTSLAARMQADGLVPFAFADRDGWPAFGTFDILDLRRNGYDFHIALLAGRERWTDPRVRGVFEAWRPLLPLHQDGALGRKWQDAAGAMVNGQAGMFFCGTFAGEQAPAELRADLDFFPFPSLGTPFDAEAAIDAPINGFMLSRSPRNVPAAKAFLEYASTAAAQRIWVTANPNYVAVANDADTSGYTSYQRRMASVIAGSARIAQFLDRDSRPDFVGPNGLQGFFQAFLADPGQDLDPFLASIQRFWDSLR